MAESSPSSSSFPDQFFDKYGLAFVMVASYFGLGSVFIASSAQSVIGAITGGGV